MSAILDNVLIPLPSLTLPRDYAWRVRFIPAVDEQLRRLRSTGHFNPPRFYGYYFQKKYPVGVSGNWVVSLEAEPPLTYLPGLVEEMTNGQYSIASASSDEMPDFLLVHDTHDGSCWLWRFIYGLRFVESSDPIHRPDDLTGL